MKNLGTLRAEERLREEEWAVMNDPYLSTGQTLFRTQQVRNEKMRLEAARAVRIAAATGITVQDERFIEDRDQLRQLRSRENDLLRARQTIRLEEQRLRANPTLTPEQKHYEGQLLLKERKRIEQRLNFLMQQERNCERDMEYQKEIYKAYNPHLRNGRCV